MLYLDLIRTPVKKSEDVKYTVSFLCVDSFLCPFNIFVDVGKLRLQLLYPPVIP